MLLGNTLSNQPLEVLEGKKTIEVRWLGVRKAVVAEVGASSGRCRIAFGDDQTDEDLFRALPPSSLTVAVGELLHLPRFDVRGLSRGQIAAPVADERQHVLRSVDRGAARRLALAGTSA